MLAPPTIQRLSDQIPVHEVFQASVSAEQAFTTEVTVDIDTADRESHDRFTIYGFGALDGLIGIGLTAEAEIDAMIVLGAETAEDIYEAEAWIEHAAGAGAEYEEVTNSRKPTGAE